MATNAAHLAKPELAKLSQRMTNLLREALPSGTFEEREQMELEAGLLEGATPALARNVAQGYGENHMRAHLELLEKAYRPPPPRASLERLAKRLAAEVEKLTARIEPKIRRLERVPEDAHAVVIGVDRTSAPMEEPSAKARKPRREAYQRTPPAPVEVSYRIAYTATVTLVDGHGEALLTRRYAIEAGDSEQDMVARAFADVRHCVTQRKDLRVAVVQDGAHEMRNWGRPELERLRETGQIRGWSEATDFCHPVERLSDALELCGDRKRSWRLPSWRTDLEERDVAIDKILSFLRFHGADPRTNRQERSSSLTSPTSRTTWRGSAIERCERERYQSAFSAGIVRYYAAS